MERILSVQNVEEAFHNLMKSIKKITTLDSYSNDHKTYGELLLIIADWSEDYMKNNQLSRINHEKLLDVYNKLDRLKEKWLFNLKLGKESELADEVVIWMWELMELRKLEIGGKE